MKIKTVKERFMSDDGIIPKNRTGSTERVNKGAVWSATIFGR